MQAFVMMLFKFRATFISDEHILHNSLKIFDLSFKVDIMNASVLLWFKVYILLLLDLTQEN